MKTQIFPLISLIFLLSCKKDNEILAPKTLVDVKTNTRVYFDYKKTSYELSNFKDWYSSKSLLNADGSKYLNNPFIDQQFTQVDINGDGFEEVFYYEGYDLNISPTPNPPPTMFNGQNFKKTPYNGPYITNAHGTKILVGDFNNDLLPDLFSLVAVDPPNNSPAGFLNTFDYNHLIINSDTGFNNVKYYYDQGFWYTGCSGDIDSDGDLDIIAFNLHNQANNVKNRIMWNNGKGDFSIDFNEIGTIPFVYQSELCDVNGDGFLDLIICFVSNNSLKINELRVLWGNGKGFTLNNSVRLQIPINQTIQNLDFLDINNDKIKEILISGNDDNQNYFINLFKSENLGGTFSNQTQKYIDQPITSKRFHHIIIGDIDKNNLLNVFSSDKNDYIMWEWNISLNKFIRK